MLSCCWYPIERNSGALHPAGNCEAILHSGNAGGCGIIRDHNGNLAFSFSHFYSFWNKERMIQLFSTSLDSESGSTLIFAEEAFVSIMGKDRSGRIRCG
ncbi:hypothetical protein Taro_052569, partial [Colocasia esculenta]|nr:hypothetical protein [Colocasia esculenta]